MGGWKLCLLLSQVISGSHTPATTKEWVLPSVFQNGPGLLHEIPDARKPGPSFQQTPHVGWRFLDQDHPLLARLRRQNLDWSHACSFTGFCKMCQDLSGIFFSSKSPSLDSSVSEPAQLQAHSLLWECWKKGVGVGSLCPQLSVILDIQSPCLQSRQTQRSRL